MEIRIVDEVGKLCMTSEDGEKIYGKILQAALNRENIIFDFEGVEAGATPCFNSSIGRFVKTIGKEDVIRLFVYKNADPYIMDLIFKVINNADRYFNEDNYKKSIDSLFAENSEE